MGEHDSLDETIRQIVRDELARHLGAGRPVYSTGHRSSWPPGCRSKRAARDRIRRVPGHRSDGPGVWLVEAEAYRAYYARRAPSKLVVLCTDEAIADAVLSGTRATRKAS